MVYHEELYSALTFFKQSVCALICVNLEESDDKDATTTEMLHYAMMYK